MYWIFLKGPNDKFKNAIEVSFPGEIDELTRKEEERKIQQRKLSFWDSREFLSDN